jgi:hypothetical protein
VYQQPAEANDGFYVISRFCFGVKTPAMSFIFINGISFLQRVN